MIAYNNIYDFFFFNDTATTEIYTLSLHDALPIGPDGSDGVGAHLPRADPVDLLRSEEHTSELQSRRDLVCRLLLEKKKNEINTRRAARTISKTSSQHPIGTI